jgi:hypothetical protein
LLDRGSCRWGPTSWGIRSSLFKMYSNLIIYSLWTKSSYAIFCTPRN